MTCGFVARMKRSVIRELCRINNEFDAASLGEQVGRDYGFEFISNQRPLAPPLKSKGENSCPPALESCGLCLAHGHELFGAGGVDGDAAIEVGFARPHLHGHTKTL